MNKNTPHKTSFANATHLLTPSQMRKAAHELIDEHQSDIHHGRTPKDGILDEAEALVWQAYADISSTDDYQEMASTCFLIAKLFYAQEDYGNAREYLKQALDYNPSHSSSLSLSERINLQHLPDESSISEYQELFETDKAGALRAIGFSCIKQYRETHDPEYLNIALKAAKKSLNSRGNKEEHRTYFLMAIAYNLLEDDEKCISCINSGLTHNPNDEKLLSFRDEKLSHEYVDDITGPHDHFPPAFHGEYDELVDWLHPHPSSL